MSQIKPQLCLCDKPHRLRLPLLLLLWLSRVIMNAPHLCCAKLADSGLDKPCFIFLSRLFSTRVLPQIFKRFPSGLGLG